MLFKVVCNFEGFNVESELKFFFEVYRNVLLKEVKIQILSIYVNKYFVRKLIELYKIYEFIIEWEFCKVKFYVNNEGFGVLVEKLIYYRVRFDVVKVNYFLDFINRLYFY